MGRSLVRGYGSSTVHTFPYSKTMPLTQRFTRWILLRYGKVSILVILSNIFLLSSKFIEEKREITSKFRVIPPFQKPQIADSYESAQFPYPKIMVGGNGEGRFSNKFLLILVMVVLIRTILAPRKMQILGCYGENCSIFRQNNLTVG